MKVLKGISVIILLSVLLTGCATKKKKSDEDYGKLKEVYHNMSSKYNGFWNAEELMKKSLISLNTQHQADYSEILEVYPYVDVENASAVAGDMDVIMKKMARLAKIHPKSDWIDDTYVMLGKAQYMKQDYETAEETFKYFEEEFDPNNPKGRLYNKSKNKRGSAEEKKKKKEAEKKKNRKIKDENMKKAKKDKADIREEKQESKDQRRKKIDRYKKDIKKIKDDLRSATKKRKNDVKKAREKARKKKKRIKTDPNADPRSAKEKELEAKLELKEKDYQNFLNPPQETLEKEELPEEEKKEEVVVEEEEEVVANKKLLRKKISFDDPKGLFKGKLAFHEGVYWLARTYTERKNYFAANYLYKKLENEYPTKKEVLALLPAGRAHLHIRQKEYSNAVPYLEDAIKNEKSKALKARYAYIIGQIHQLNGNKSEASQAFQRVNKFKPDYELRFNSKLNLAKASWASGQNSKANALSTLNKMLKDRKNDDYQDQIYFTIGNIHEEDGNFDEAIASYQSSTENSTRNKKQKLESYYRISTLLFNQEKYVEASAYYDSTLTVMEIEDDRYYEVKDYAGSLKDIAANIQTIEFQDSLLYLSTLSKDELEKRLGKIVDEQLEAQESGEEQPANNKNFIERNNGFGSNQSSFFAYDETLVLAGQRIFERKWGQRGLSDNWRRSNRLGAIDVEIEEEEEESNDSAREEALLALMGSVPTTPSKKGRANQTREKALFELGLLFKNKLNNNEKCIESLTTLLQDYPKTKNEPEALFYLYISYQDLGNLSKAANYKKQLVDKYPNAKFSQSLTNPDFAQEQSNERNKEELFYTDTYSQFENGSHQEVLNRIEEAKTKLSKTHPLMPKYALLQAMSVGSINGKEAYIKSLQELIARYPNTGEETRAKEILRFIRGDKKAFDSRLYDEDSEDFSIDDDKLHYVIVVLYDDKENSLQDVKIKISDYNKKYHQLEKLRISDLPLNRDEGVQLVLIRKFRNKDKAMKYFNGTKKNSADFIDPNKYGFDIFATTQKNYREIAKKKNVLDYRPFFEKNYLNKKEN